MPQVGVDPRAEALEGLFRRFPPTEREEKAKIRQGYFDDVTDAGYDAETVAEAVERVKRTREAKSVPTVGVLLKFCREVDSERAGRDTRDRDDQRHTPEEIRDLAIRRLRSRGHHRPSDYLIEADIRILRGNGYLVRGLDVVSRPFCDRELAELRVLRQLARLGLFWCAERRAFVDGACEHGAGCVDGLTLQAADDELRRAVAAGCMPKPRRVPVDGWSSLGDSVDAAMGGEK